MIMDSAIVHDSKSTVAFEDMPKVDKMAKDSIGNSGRKMLADISNMPRKSSLAQDNKSRANSSTMKEYIEKLQKENAAFMKLLADKNKIIDISGSELQKLRITLQKMQQQNLHLARSNSEMLEELTKAKDRLKEMQHQLGCKNSLLVAMRLELEGKRKAKVNETNDTKKVKVSTYEANEVCTEAERDREQQRNNTNGRQKSKSLGPSDRKVQEKGVDESARILTRRQSARFKHDEAKPTEELFKTDDRMQEDASNAETLSVKQDVGDNSLTNEVTQVQKRLSIPRPSRESAKKVQSYKEVSILKKMRRPE